MIEPEMMKELVCPLGKYALTVQGDFLICSNCGVKFPIIDNIPVLLIDEAVLPDGINSIVELACMKK